MSKRSDIFRERAKRGRRFEAWERSRWTDPEHAGKEEEAGTEWGGKRGRIDLRLVDEEAGFAVLTEIKATDWDRMAPHRVRPNALRHARQLWRYIEAELLNMDVVPALVYPCEPQVPGRKAEVETILDELGIQVVWRGLDIDTL